MDTVSVIIPTTCEASRRASLMRAIDSVLNQQGAQVTVIAVVNGNRIDPECLQQLQAMARVQVVRQEQGCQALAQRTGRACVVTAFFAFLDDDDEYLPVALKLRLAPLLREPGLDFVASNGLRRQKGVDQAVVTQVQAAERDPLLALASENWLASCGGLFRTARIGVDFFDGKTASLEWTLLAYKLASTRSMAFVDQPTFIINDTAGSLSKSEAYVQAEAGVLAQVLALDLPSAARRAVQEKLGRCLHNISARKSEQGDWAEAWRFHLASLGCLHGWKYLLYSRKLLLPRPRVK